jgi:GT2 family glycosyltransferase
MKLYDFLLPRKGICEDPRLFYHVISGHVSDTGGALAMSACSSISLDTFFNCFSASKYCKYTNLNSVTVRLELQGDFDVRIEAVAYSGTVTLEQRRMQKSGFFTVNLADCPSVSYLTVRMTALEDGVFYGGGYEGEAAQRFVKTGIVICTFRREQYVKANLERIRAYAEKNPDIKKKLHVFVVDNGNTLGKEIENELVTLIPNPNLGGSGGFSRGMYEVHKREKEGFTHMLLMDDDIVFYPETLEKTFSFLAIAKEKYADLCIGAGMMRLDKPYFQHEFGAFWGGWRVFAYNGQIDLRNPSAILANERIYNPEYSAWWYMCMPAANVKKYGLPLPMFIKGDDVEYGLRACRHIVVLNGIGVWHEPFNLKFSAELEYYIKRNEAILSSLYSPEQNAISLFKKLLRAAAYQIVCFRYDWAEMYFRAYRDFLKGADYINAIDMPELHKELRSHNAKSVSKAELLKMLGREEILPTKLNEKQSVRRLKYTLNGYLIPRFFYRFCEYNNQGMRIQDATNLKLRGFYCTNEVLIYNPHTETGYMVRLKKRMLFRFGFELIELFFKLVFGYRKAAATYQGKLEELSSIQSWEKKFFR